VKRQRPTREQLIELAKTDPEAIADLVLMLWDRVEMLDAKVAELERNSRTSSKPPSSDAGNLTNPPKPKSRRKKSGRKPGGQKGHRGETLKRSDNPNEVVEHRLDKEALCPKCGAPLGEGPAQLDAENCECRQVFELPAIRLEITEHRAEKRRCPQCGEMITAAFPEGVAAPVQYGEKLRATGLYLGAHQLVPYQRLSEIFSDLFNCPLSVGTLANFVKAGGRKAAEAMGPVRDALVAAKVAHADEPSAARSPARRAARRGERQRAQTGCRVGGKRHWLHVFSTGWLTSFHIDEKRGVEGMTRTGLLERFTGSLVHDFLSSYYRLLCRHFLCGAHLLRELTYLHEEMDQPWAGDMIELLLEAKSLREREDARAANQRKIIGEKTRERIRRQYCEIVLEGFALNPEPPPPPEGKRGRVNRGKPLNLLIRLEEHYEEIMGFFEYEGLPFDNNQAERDLRMMKTREKISGTFRSVEHPRAFADLRSIISPVRKQSRNLLGTLMEMFRTPHSLGESLACQPEN
jgi:transposase